jgi:hypothetical protein
VTELLADHGFPLNAIPGEPGRILAPRCETS